VSAGTRQEAEEAIKSQKPRDWIVNRRNIDYALDQMFKVQETPFIGRPLESFVVPDSLDEWLFGNFM